jgi:hypothetical protein
MVGAVANSVLAEARSSPEVILRWPSSEARGWALQLIQDLSGDPRVIALVAFGSCVRPGLRSCGDLDILLVYRNERPATEEAPHDVDFVSYREDAVEGLLSGGEDLLNWALRLGRPILDPLGFWTNLQHDWSGRLPLPRLDQALARARRNVEWAQKLLRLGGEERAADHLTAALVQIARLKLIGAGVFPASRPELCAQLESIGAARLADALRCAITRKGPVADQLLRAEQLFKDAACSVVEADHPD